MMKEFLSNTLFWGLCLTLISYGIGVLLKKYLKLQIFNPLLIAAIICISFLLIFNIDYDSYNESSKYISYLLTPATISLAVPLYKNLEALKKNSVAVVLSIFTGVLSSLFIIFILCLVLKMDHESYVSFLPKSITTAIGMDLSKEMGGYVSITVVVIIITGIFGSIISDLVFKVCRIDDPISRGLALGSSSHAIGTAKAFELGEIEGAMSSLSIVISGIFTVILAPIFANFI